MSKVYLPSELGRLVSRGSISEKASSLGGLHEKRKVTLAQFFTPYWVTKYLWESILPAFSQDGGEYSLLDNSIGNCGMFRFADPDKFHLCGFDVDGELTDKVVKILDKTRFRFDILHGAMENVELEKFSAGLINPPFSITLSSPFLKVIHGVTHYGKYGPNSSASSHEYALAQALCHCDIVAAVVPESTKHVICKNHEFANRLRAIFELPADTFKGENVKSVKTDLLIFGRSLEGPAANAPEEVRIKKGKINKDSIPSKLYQLSCRSINELGFSRHPIKVVGVEESKPVITTPVTGNSNVMMKLSGRKIKLEFFDGATEGRVKNEIYQKRLYSNHLHKYPSNTKYAGQFKLNIDVICMQDDPAEAMNELCKIISKAGGKPIIDEQLKNGIKRISDEIKKMSIPFGRTVYRKGGDEFKATAKKMGLINKSEKGAVVGINEEVMVRRSGGVFKIKSRRGEFSCREDTFFSLFKAEDNSCDEGCWEEIFPEIEKSFPKEIGQLRMKAKKIGIEEWLDWDFQVTDACELAFKPKGAICGWQMGLGKSRLAITLGLLLNGKTLIVLKSRLISEMENELKLLGISDYKIIKSKSDIEEIGKINIISYERIKRPIHPDQPKITLAKFLRKKIKNVICDEGGLLANKFSQQSKAIWQLGAKRKYIFDGIPAGNYSRELLNLAAWTVGEERAYQPYSMNGGFVEKRIFNSAEWQPTGRDEFHRRYVTIEWSTNEFNESGVGARREIPKINPNYLDDYRKWLAPILKRRLQQEPSVSKYIRFPVPELCNPIEIDWSLEHLLLYVKVGESFAEWYRKYANEKKEKGKALNLTIILARLEACFKAANLPSEVRGYGKGFQDLTTKEIACLKMIKEQVNDGLRPIVFAKNPAVLRRLSGELGKIGITNLVFTGEETINKRTIKLNKEVRKGNADVMLASLGVTQDGLNLAMLNSVIFYNRSFKSREEYQAIYRLIRPQQKHEVKCNFLHLKGSIDGYMHQLSSWKNTASEAGLDYGEQEENNVFVHFDAFIQRFINSIPDLKEELELKKKIAA